MSGKELSYHVIADRVQMHKASVSTTLTGMMVKPRTAKLLAEDIGNAMERIDQWRRLISGMIAVVVLRIANAVIWQGEGKAG